MDSNFENAIKSLERDVEDVTDTFTDVRIDTFQLELDLRKQELELATKRKHVSQLREEIDGDKQIIHDLKMHLKQANAKVASLEVENRIFKQNWDELDSKHVSCTEEKLRHSVLEQENVSLKDTVRKAESEKIALQRKNDDLLLQQTIHEENMKKILEEDNNIRATINKHAEALNDMGKEKLKVTELHNKLGEFQMRLQEADISKNKIGVYEKRTSQLEDDFTSCRAKLEMLEELLHDYSLPQSVQRSDLHKYFEEKADDLQRQLEAERELVLKQHERLNKEINANVCLCGKVAELEKKLEGMERQRCKLTGNVENAIV